MKEGVQRHQFVMLLQVGSHYKQHPQRNTQSMFFFTRRTSRQGPRTKQPHPSDAANPKTVHKVQNSGPHLASFSVPRSSPNSEPISHGCGSINFYKSSPSNSRNQFKHMGAMGVVYILQQNSIALNKCPVNCRNWWKRSLSDVNQAGLRLLRALLAVKGAMNT